MGFKPRHTYLENVKKTTRLELNFSGSKEVMDAMKSKGLTNPTIKSTNQSIEANFITGDVSAESVLPVTIEFNKVNGSDENVKLMEGAKVYGKIKPGELPSIDSMVSDKLDENVKSAASSMMQSMLSQMVLPNKKMKIGDHLKQETPLKIPVSGMNIECIVKTDYKLLSISGNNANFEINMKYTIEFKKDKIEITGGGEGKGTMQYDIDNEFFNTYSIKSDTRMHTEIETLKMDVRVQENTEMTISLHGN